MPPITIYGTTWCVDCWRAKSFLKERGVQFHEVNIEDDPAAEELVLRVNNGRRKVATIRIGERHFACSPFSARKLAEELKLPLSN